MTDFRQRLLEAVQEGVVLGVKWTVALAVLGAVVYLAAGDYNETRRNAAAGREAYSFLLKMQQEAQAPPAQPGK